MITLDVEGHCHECDAFEPYVDTTIYSQDEPFAKYVRCSNAKRYPDGVDAERSLRRTEGDI